MDEDRVALMLKKLKEQQAYEETMAEATAQKDKGLGFSQISDWHTGRAGAFRLAIAILDAMQKESS